MRLRLADPAYAERLTTFLRSVGVTASPGAEGALDLDPSVDENELEIYLGVWSVLNPEGAAELEREED
jgi:hypothetical protein